MSTEIPRSSTPGDLGRVDEATRGGSLSLEGLHGSVPVPPPAAGFWAQWRVFVGPALLVSVGYMDPGNWGTDLSAGA
jgi:manganese transport protein